MYVVRQQYGAYGDMVRYGVAWWYCVMVVWCIMPGCCDIVGMMVWCHLVPYGGMVIFTV